MAPAVCPPLRYSRQPVQLLPLLTRHQLRRPGRTAEPITRPGHQGPNRTNPQPRSPHCIYPVQPPANSALTAQPHRQAALAKRPPGAPRDQRALAASAAAEIASSGPKKALKPAALKATRAAAPASRPRGTQASKAHQRVTGAAGKKQRSAGGPRSEPTVDWAPRRTPQKPRVEAEEGGSSIATVKEFLLQDFLVRTIDTWREEEERKSLDGI
ncbi:hypothetical protein NDU88_006405 [Pleurodeles waltl]|uniref:Uncharacterized protein n=1 Tax=Pleurodeles waltl TaxID=8319 RepID=A0AAV7TWR0_PLEWA|nr:hypothetical protein NDU88_006405 [Pleurodeles waltl]